MNISTFEALAVEVHPHSPTQWVATYYPLVSTPAGRWANVTWVLHQHRMPATPVPPASTRWLEACSPDPHHSCYAGHQTWAPQLAAGYATALATYTTDTTQGLPFVKNAGQLPGSTIMVPAGQLTEWILDDFEDETSPARG